MVSLQRSVVRVRPIGLVAADKGGKVDILGWRRVAGRAAQRTRWNERSASAAANAAAHLDGATDRIVLRRSGRAGEDSVGVLGERDISRVRRGPIQGAREL